MGFDDEIKTVVPSVFHLLGSSSDNQQSNESYNVKKFGIPNPAGKSGSACTSLFLKLMYEKGGANLTWWDLYSGVKSNLQTMGFDNQTPTFTSTRKINLKKERVQIVPPGSGKRRALLIGCNYVGSPEELRSCHNDCLNLKNYLLDKEGFNEAEMMVLIDDGKHTPPTKSNIQDAFIMLAQYSRPGDVNFISFSGHGGKTKDLDGDEEDGMDSTLIPIDAKKEGMIVDDDSVTTTVLMDCCYSGTVLDLPYELKGTKMVAQPNYNMEIVTKAVKPLSKDQLLAKKKKEKLARKEARAAERQRRKEEEAKRQAQLDIENQAISQADIDAAKQQLLRQAQARIQNMTVGGNNVIMGPVQVVSGAMPPSQPGVITYRVPVGATRAPAATSTAYKPKVAVRKSATSPNKTATKTATTRKPKKMSGLIAKFENNN